MSETSKICKGFEYRSTLNTRALTVSIVVLDGKVLRPTRSERSRTGAHGVDYYCLEESEWSRAWIIELRESNSGKRYIETVNVPGDISKLLAELWLYENASVSEVEQVARLLYMQEHTR
jgi:hypothetical protein